MDAEEIRRRVETVPVWWHSIDVGSGVSTDGHKSSALLADEWAALDLPDLTGKRVLDIGAWDGFFSFSCEERGAAEVVALDHHVWSMDIAGYSAYRDECMRTGARLEPPQAVPGLWQPDALPGRRGFDTAAALRGSKVEPVVADFMEMDLEPLGRFDVVLYLGVLYHIADPFLALRRLASVTRELAVIETEAVVLPAYPDQSLARFHPFDELNADPTNWWVPTFRALADMCLAAGFAEVVPTRAPPGVPPKRRFGIGPARPGDPRHYRLVVQARKPAGGDGP